MFAPRFIIFQLVFWLSFPVFSADQDKLLTNVQEGWKLTQLLRVGDKLGNYRMVGAPDGLGAMLNPDGTLTILMNHELAKDAGKVRSHQAEGAFVSQWTLDIETLTITGGEDLIKQVNIWHPESRKYHTDHHYRFNRLCSADLPSLSALYDKNSRTGFQGRLFMNGEEDRSGGRAFAHIVSGPMAGQSFELPHMGKSAWENIVLNPKSQRKTIALGMDDSPGGQVYMFVGEKRADGNPIERAGLSNGELYGLKRDGNTFSWHSFGDVSAWSGEQLEKAGQQAGVVNFMRPEDGAWDTRNPNIFYFATTDKIDGTSQLFQLRFEDISAPEKGGQIQTVLNARDIGAQMFDNITVASDGTLLIEEDPGDNPYMAGIWQFNPMTGKAVKVVSVSEQAFKNQSSQEFLTQDEENSGIIEVTDLLRKASWFKEGHRYYLGALQIHAKSADIELVEDGMLYLLEQQKQ